MMTCLSKPNRLNPLLFACSRLLQYTRAPRTVGDKASLWGVYSSAPLSFLPLKIFIHTDKLKELYHTQPRFTSIHDCESALVACLFLDHILISVKLFVSELQIISTLCD